MTTLGIYAQGKGVEIVHATGETTKHMASDPRRLARIDVAITLRLNVAVDAPMEALLRRVAHTCPVARSLHPDVEQDVTMTFLS